MCIRDSADTGRGVAGAVFEVYHADGAFIGRYTTDAQGEVLIRPIEPGHYIVREVAAPDDYEPVSYTHLLSICVLIDVVVTRLLQCGMRIL